MSLHPGSSCPCKICDTWLHVSLRLGFEYRFVSASPFKAGLLYEHRESRQHMSVHTNVCAHVGAPTGTHRELAMVITICLLRRCLLIAISRFQELRRHQSILTCWTLTRQLPSIADAVLSAFILTRVWVLDRKSLTMCNIQRS